jgi:hypothetical protein
MKRQFAHSHSITRWAKEIKPECVWQEYPRPQMRRKEWLNLNGLWEYGITSWKQHSTLKFEGKILVPFPLESALSGAGRRLCPDERLWYRRTFSIPLSWREKHVLLHFGAVDWEATVWINGNEVGKHRGGYLPFHFDITDALFEGENELVVSVWDPTDTYWQQHGKQTLKPKSIWYTAVSGIWQTVWLEPVSEIHISCLKVTPDIDAQSVKIEAELRPADEKSMRIEVKIYDKGEPITEGHSTGASIDIPVRDPKLWSPDSPHLYELEVKVAEDTVESYFGMRKFSLENGHLCLNHEALFQFGPLDQGYWPDGLYTPPSDEAMRSDVDLVKSLGFNMLRKHVKVEPARYYYYCDRIGLIVWQDMVNGGAAVGDVTSFLAILFGSRRRDRNYRYAGRADPDSRSNYRTEMKETIDHLYNFPCIGMWVPFNEGWGQFDANEAADWLKTYDPTRPVDHASGWFDQGGGDCKSLHVYFKKLPVIKAEAKRAAVLSEFGGYSMKIEGHLWNSEAEFGYKKYKSRESLTEAYIDLLENELKPCIISGLSAAVYTQTTDVEIEVNGYVTYDREVEKMDFKRIQEIHRGLCSSKPRPV